MMDPRWRPAYVGIGSNLDGPSEQVERAIVALDQIDATIVVLRSNLYRSAPMGPADQPDFINAVAALLTKLAPRELLVALQSIEKERGRTRGGGRWGPRILDLDLLSIAGMACSDNELTLPHPGIVDRSFVLLPWCEIAPNYNVPGLGRVATLTDAINLEIPRIEKLS